MSNQRFTGTDQSVATDDLITLAINEIKHSFPGVGIAHAAAAATSITQGPLPAVS
jgi:hypothetical protein